MERDSRYCGSLKRHILNVDVVGNNGRHDVHSDEFAIFGLHVMVQRPAGMP
jgi:hypothetical protein